jgi:Mg-chelatase subunit ChlD
MNNRVHIMREAVVKITQLLAGKKVKVTQRGVKAFVESDTRTGEIKRVNLPYIPDDASDEFIEAIQGYLDHEVGHILFSDFKVIGRADGSGHGKVLNVIEDPRIEKCMAAEFRGAGYNLRRVGEFVLNQRVKPAVQLAMKTGDVALAQQALLMPVFRSLAGQDLFTEFLKEMPEAFWRPIMDLLEDLRPQFMGMKSTADAYELAKLVKDRFSDDPESSEGGEGDDEGDGGSSSGSGEKGDGKQNGKSKPDSSERGEDDESGAEDDSPSSGGDGDDGDGDDGGDSDKGDGGSDESDPSSGAGEEEGSAGREDESGGRSGSDASGSGEREGEGERDGGKKRIEVLAHPDAAGDFDDALAELISMKARDYAESASYSIYTKDLDKIEVLDTNSKWISEVKPMEDRVDHMVGPLQKELERIMAARSAVVWAGGQRRGRLHGAGLSRLTFGDTRVFRKREESRSKEWAVEILVDMSGSMSSSNKIGLAADAAYACAAVFERMRIKCEVICFTTGLPADHDGADFAKCTEGLSRKRRTVGPYATYGGGGGGFSRYEPLYMPILKTYDEHMTPDVKSRFAGLRTYGHRRNNVDGESLEVAAMRLLTRREAGKLLIVLSDGHPQAMGNTDEQASHLKRVVQNIVASKRIKLFGVGINDDSVRRFYPDYVVLRDINKLAETMMHQLKRLIFS